MRILPLLLLSAAACAPRPVIYPDEKYKAPGGEQAARADADACMADAKKYLADHPINKIGRRTGAGAIAGAVMGTVIGAFTGDYARAVSEGAAVGAAGGAVSGGLESTNPDEVKRAYVSRCLAEKGWTVLGWR